MGSAHFIAAAFEKMFEEKVALTLKQVANCISYMTEDITLAKFVIAKGFDKDFTDLSNADADAPQHLKFTETNICEGFLKFYKAKFESQVEAQLTLFKSIP